MADNAHQIADLMADVARDLDRPGTGEEQLELIVAVAGKIVPGADSASVTVLRGDGHPETVAHLDELALSADRSQYELDEGPCLDAARGQPFVQVDDLPHEQRWPRYGPRAGELGISAQMAVELYADDRSIGGLNLYSRSSRAFDPDARHVAWLLATYAALAMSRTRRVADLDQAVVSRQVIGQATGAVMQRYGFDEERAFQFLVQLSQSSNTKLRAVARQMIDHLNAKARNDAFSGDPPRPAQPRRQ